MAVDMADVLRYTVNTIWNDAISLSIVTFYDLVQVLIVVGGVFIFRKIYNICLCSGGNVITSSVVEVDDDNSNSKNSTIEECTETTGPRLLTSRYESKPMTRQDHELTDYGSNLRRLNNMHDKPNAIPKAKTIDSCPEDTTDGLGKRSMLKVLTEERVCPVERTITVYPARQHEHTNCTPTNTDPPKCTNGPHGMESDAEDDEGIRGVAGVRTDNRDPTPDIVNQGSGEGSDSRQENQRSDESSRSGQAATAESLGVVARPEHPEFKLLTTRLHTYRAYPYRLQRKAQDLANAGFFFTGYRDHTICFFCGGGLKEWETEDDPWVEHASWFPNCSFVIGNKQQRFVDRVQGALRHRHDEYIQQLTPHQQRQLSRRQHSQLQQRRQNVPNELHASNRNTVPPGSEYLSTLSTSAGSDSANLPAYPQYANLASRSDTFQEPCDLNNLQMAEAGFFCTGPGVIICFNCGGPLYTWKPGDDIWIEHARWFPNCSYLKAKRGQRFIMDVQERFEQLTPRLSCMLTRRDNNLETSNPQSPTVAGYTSDHARRLETSNPQSPTVAGYTSGQTRRLEASYPQSPTVAGYTSGQTRRLDLSDKRNQGPDIISNRNAAEINRHRTVYAPRVTRNTQTGHVVESYQWDLLCQICQENSADVTFVPCGHIVCCRRCARREQVCPECHSVIAEIRQA